MKVRNLQGFHKHVFFFTAVIFALLFLISCASARVMTTEARRSLYLMFSVMLTFMLYPPIRGKGGQTKIPIYDYILVALAATTFIYWLMTFMRFATVSRGMANQLDFYMGIICILLMFEAARRVLGPILLIVGGAFMLQLYFGPYMPGIFAHRGFTLFRIVEFLYRTSEGIFGTIASTFATFVLPFIIMGAFLEVSGAGEFFIKLSLALTRGWAGGPAKVSVLGSALMGSISGSSVANVVATGPFTIPMMKRVGFKAEHAGAIEAAASTGGQFLPPVMGAGAFLLATMTETPYLVVARMNIIPALLYFFWVGVIVHFYSKKHDIGSLPNDEIPPLKETLKDGWFFFTPILLVFVMLFSGMSIERSAFAATISCIVLSWFKKDKRMGVREIANALALGAKSNITVGASIGMLGIVMSGITLAGMGQKFGMTVIALSGGYVFNAIVLVGIVGVIVGMGATQTATYIVMSLIVVPGLVVLGVDLVIAHIIAFWFSGLSNVTPPVAVSAMAASAIAGSDPIKTGVIGIKYCLMIFILPFTFVYFPEILLQGTWGGIIYVTICFMLGMIVFASGVEGFFIAPLNWLERIAMMGAGLLVFVPGGLTDASGAVIAGVVILRQVWERRRATVTT